MNGNLYIKMEYTSNRIKEIFRRGKHDYILETSPGNAAHCKCCGRRILEGEDRVRHAFPSNRFGTSLYFYCDECGKKLLGTIKPKILEKVEQMNNVDKKMKLEQIKTENLKEAKKQVATEITNAEIEFAKKRYRLCVNKIDAFDREIKDLEDEKKVFVDELKKFDK